MKPGERLKKGVLLRRKTYVSGIVHIDIILVQGQAEKGEEIVYAGGIVIKGEFQGNLILKAVTVGIIRPETPEHFRQLVHGPGDLQVQLVQPCFVDEEMPVGVDTLGDEESELVNMAVRSGKLLPQTGLVHTGRIVGQEALVDIFIQRDQKMAGYAVFLHIQGSPQDHVRHLSLGKGQTDGAAPFGILDFTEVNMNACLLFDLPVIPHTAEVHGDIVDLILQRGKGCAGRGRALSRP